MSRQRGGIPLNPENLDAERGRLFIPTGGVASSTFTAHKTRHQDGGADEISVTGLSGLLADDQHVLDAEVLKALGFVVCYEDTVVCHENNIVHNEV